MLIHFNIF